MPQTALPTIPWGTANPRRGAPYIEAALVFQHDYPIDSELTTDTFSAWSVQQGLLKPLRAVAKHSDTWKAHVQDRNELIRGTNKAASTPQVIPAYKINVITRGLLKVRPALDLFHAQRLGRKCINIARRQERALAYLLQSEEFVKLSQIEKFYAYNLYDDMQALRNHVRYATEQHEQRLLNLAQRLLSTPATDKLRRFLASAHQQQLALPLDTTDPDQDTSRGRRGR